MTKFYPYAAQKAERLADYESAMELYKQASLHALSKEDRVTYIESYQRCKEAQAEMEMKDLTKPLSSGQEPKEKE